MPTNFTHGSAVSIEYPSRVLDGGQNTPGSHPRRAGWGTDVRQRANTGNWFHFSIPTQQGQRLRDARLQCWLNEWARVDSYHVWLGGHQVYAQDNIGGLQNTHVSPWGNGLRQIPGNHHTGDRAVNLSIHVSFLPGNAPGWVRFYGAGAQTI